MESEINKPLTPSNLILAGRLVGLVEGYDRGQRINAMTDAAALDLTEDVHTLVNIEMTEHAHVAEPTPRQLFEFGRLDSALTICGLSLGDVNEHLCDSVFMAMSIDTAEDVLHTLRGVIRMDLAPPALMRGKGRAREHKD